jgi:hypothetical protein
LELDEYRESVDIDFLCRDKKSFRAVREQVTNRTLGELVKEDFMVGTAKQAPLIFLALGSKNG